MWGNAGKWLQDRAQEVAAKAQEVAAKAEEVRQTRLVSDLEAHGKTLIQNLVAAGTKINEQEILYNTRFTYVTDRVIGMAFPQPFDSVARILSFRHKGHYMMWNLSEESYDYSVFENQVLEYRFPGHPAPPLGLLIKICTSIENWLQADEKNVAIVHCLTGKGRTATVISALLCWLDHDVGQGGGTATTMQALQYVSEKMSLDPDKATIPSQRRYLQYFNNMLDGVKPRPEPLLLRRVIMNTIPRFGAPPKPASATTDGAEEGQGDSDQVLGCCPYLQLFKGGKLIFTAACSREGSTASAMAESPHPSKAGGGVTVLPWTFPSDGSIIFNVDAVLQGDILIRARHLTASGQKISMFRAAFHTGYVPCGVLRLSKAQLDGACADGRFDPDFFIDLIFAPAEGTPGSPAPSPTPPDGDAATNTAAQRRDMGVPADAADKENYDAMLHNDTRFWNEIAARKRRAAARARREKQQQEQVAGAAGAAPAQAKPAFSISGEEEEEEEEEDKDASEDPLIVFDATPRLDLPTPSGLPPLPSSSQLRAAAAAARRAMTSGDDDDLAGEDLSHHHGDPEADELIRQLQAAAASIDGSTSGAKPQQAAAAPAAAPPAAAPIPAPAPAKPSVPAPAPAPESGGATASDKVDVLSALEDLEKELGLDSVLLSSTSGSGSGPSAASAPAAPPATAGTTTTSAAPADALAGLGLDDNLDEFEGFLKSLESSGGGGAGK